MWGILEPLGHTNYGRDFFSYRKCLARSGLFQFQRSFERKMRWWFNEFYGSLTPSFGEFSHTFLTFSYLNEKGEGDRPWGYEAMTWKTLYHMDLSEYMEDNGSLWEGGEGKLIFPFAGICWETHWMKISLAFSTEALLVALTFSIFLLTLRPRRIRCLCSKPTGIRTKGGEWGADSDSFLFHPW